MDFISKAILFLIFLAPLVFLTIRFVRSLRCIRCKRFNLDMMYLQNTEVSLFSPRKYTCFACEHLIGPKNVS